MTVLKPCPFCGGEAIHSVNQAAGYYVAAIECRDCGVRSKSYARPVALSAAAVALAEVDWNTRADDAALTACPDGMSRLIEMTFAVDQDGEDFHVRNSTRIPDGVSWAEAFHGATQIADDLARQIAERFNCPWHPKNIKETGEPDFAERDTLSAALTAAKARETALVELLREGMAIADQIAFDFKYPPSADSQERRIERADKWLDRVEDIIAALSQGERS